MTTTHTELSDSPSYKKTINDDMATYEIGWLIEGTSSINTAVGYAETNLPATVGTMTLAEISVQPAAELGDDFWYCRGLYASANNPKTVTAKEGGDSTTSFDTTGGTFHITQGIGDPEATTPDASTAPDFDGAIGVDADGNVQGCDIVVPQLVFEETHWKAAADVDQTYILAVADCTGKVNSATFRGFAAYSVLFLGASGQQQNNGLWQLTYRFVYSPNKTSMSVGSISGINKYGHDYLWVLYEPKNDSTAKYKVQQPKAAYVHEVYESAAFATVLEI